MIQLIDRFGNIVAQVESSAFPLKMPLKMLLGEKEYFLKVFYEPDGVTPRSAILNTENQ